MVKNNKTMFTILQKDIDCIEKSSDGETTLYITGIANSGQRDLVDDILTQDALQKITEQAPLHNLHLDHDKSIDGIIGTIEEAQLLDAGVKIRASILPEFQTKIKHLLENGVKLGLSVSGNCVRDSVDYDTIIDWELVEISLTPIPCDQNTMGTVTVSKSMADFIQTIQKTNNNKNKSEETIMAEEITKEDIIELINTAFAEKQEEMLESIRKEIKEEFQVTIDELIKRIEALETIEGQEGGDGGNGGDGTEGTAGGDGGKNGDGEEDEEDEEKLKSFVSSIVKSTVEEMNQKMPSQKKPLFKHDPNSSSDKNMKDNTQKGYTPEEMAKLL